jgi:uncharacterized membrane protein YvbJ
MKCPNCGRKIKDKNVSYCPYCGESLGSTNQDLREVTRVQLDYHEAKNKERNWGITSCISLIIAAVLIFTVPLGFLIAIPFFVFGIVGLILTGHYEGKAKKIKDRL